MKIKTALPLAFSALLLTAATVGAAPEPAALPQKEPQADADAPKPENAARASANETKAGKASSTPSKSAAHDQPTQCAQAEALLTHIDTKLDELRGGVAEIKTSLTDATSAVNKHLRTNQAPTQTSVAAWTSALSGQRVLGIDLAVLLFALLVGPLLSWLMTRSTLRNAGLL